MRSLSAAFARATSSIETKPDATPVTEADRLVESTLRSILAIERPDDVILGEEEGGAGSGGAPLDHRPDRRNPELPREGSRSGRPSIALEVEGVVQLGVVSAPALHKRWWAERGGGAHVERRPGARVSRPPGRGRRADASRSTSRCPALATLAWHARGYGDFWAHMLVAEGAVDGAVDAVGVTPWDLAAVQPIVEEAGGTLHGLRGGGTDRRRQRGDVERAPARTAARRRRRHPLTERPARCPERQPAARTAASKTGSRESVSSSAESRSLPVAGGPSGAGISRPSTQTPTTDSAAPDGEHDLAAQARAQPAGE